MSKGFLKIKAKERNVIYSKRIPTEDKQLFRDFLNFIKLKDSLKSDSVYIKPNLMSYVHPEYYCITSPILLNHLIDWIAEMGKKPIIIESDMLNTQVFPNLTVENVARKVISNKKAEVVNLSKEKRELYEHEGKSVEVPEMLNRENHDFSLINFPKLKSHPITILTLSLKNMYGCLPNDNKYELYHQNWKIDKAIALINNYITPDFTILDGIKGQDNYDLYLKETKRGYYYPYGFLFGSENPYIIDKLIADLIGIDSERIGYLNELKDLYTTIYRIVGDQPNSLKDFDYPDKIGVAFRKLGRKVSIETINKFGKIRFTKEGRLFDEDIFGKTVFDDKENLTLKSGTYNITEKKSEIEESEKFHIVSPSFGRVVKVNKKEIQIFIPFKANHKLYAPSEGIIKSLKFKRGKFQKNIFESKKMKRGSATITIEGNITISFTAFVGLPYRVKRIRIDKKIGNKVKKGEVIGEILYGSLSETYIPKNINFTPLVSFYDNIIGGITKIAEYSL